ncbi:transmembrane protein 41A isoform X1 [Octopus bimaculoides]|uniref:VTT domain-containing protein n=1 Tax=Octopus bimaculoides TaxID=37653 RepID=A0A0L8H2A5_OCTBM|nr:transmembrane protein 41A isoform X1 [Octopus bimaculoides]|eukprot:XP_014776129.1 PREDICTED: transmembrane protein 41A-like [Octopus bimaculoides]
MMLYEQRWLCVPILFALSSIWIYYLSTYAPAIGGEHSNSTLRFPSNLEELNSLVSHLSLYKNDHMSYIFLLFCSAYLYKQAFAIPGSVFLNLLAGALFGTVLGFITTSFLTACGATCCYLLSENFGKPYIIKKFHKRISYLNEKIQANMDSLFYFLLFLRLFPMSPNWFLNISSPILDIPIHYFFFSVLVGLMPYNFICVQTGCVLSSIRSVNDIFTISTVLKLLGIAVVAVLPGCVIKFWKQKSVKQE